MNKEDKCPMCGEQYGNCQRFKQYDLVLCEDCTDPSVAYERAEA